MAEPDLSTTLGLLYEAVAEPELWPDALTRIADHVGGFGAFLIRHDFERDTGSLIVGRMRDDLVPLYLGAYARNPFSLELGRRGANRSIERARGLANPDEIRRTAFSADILEPQGMVDQIIFPHASLTRNGNTGGLAIGLDSRQAEQADEVARRFEPLVPHVSRAIDLSLTLMRHSEKIGGGALLPALPQAALITDRSGRVVDANQAGRRLLAREDMLRLGSDARLEAILPEDKARLNAAIGQTARHAQGDHELSPASLTVRRLSGLPPCLVLVTALPPGRFAFWVAGDGELRLLIQIIDPAGSRSSVDILRIAYGLTPAEAKVADLIGSGMSVPQCSEAVGVTASTVRTHLGHVFDKLGVRSQVALARILAQLPAA